MKTFKTLSSLLLTGAIFIQSMVLLGKTWWFFELFTHYAPYYATIGSFFAILTLARRNFVQALLWITLVSMNLGVLSPYLTTQIQTNSAPPDLTLLTQNVYYLNSNTEELLELATQIQPDIVVIHEAGSVWKEGLDSFQELYPYTALTKNTGVHGIAMASKIPGTFKEIPLGEHTGLEFTPLSGAYHILGVHPEAPLTSTWAKDRNAQFADLSLYVQSSSVPVLVTGDFNCTPWSPYFSDLLQKTGLRDARLGFGFVPTWHAHEVWFQLPSDNFQLRLEWTARRFVAIATPSSDHRAIWTTLQNPEIR